ncbi:FAD:protein FMN transferase [Phycicoccus sp. Root563]|uniref:FAD:protein FMN transferase n=1 Tax=Phycicoccus sp. Root563 TaxID=1736562 RepID=UPI000B1C69D5|nr:FAD:protein FMN transferase [Phycicoccus sp. Root563]
MSAPTLERPGGATGATSQPPTRSGSDAALPRRAFVTQVMGLPVSAHVRGRVDTPEVEAAVGQVWSTLQKVDALFSTWRTDSELMRLRRGELDGALAHPWHEEVALLCAEAQRRTAGLFTASYPGAGGYDPTGLVKGWAVAKAAAHLANVPGISFCLNAGGDLVAGAGRDTRPSTWRVGIEDPARPGIVAATLDLATGGLATSGTAARGAHIADPRSGGAVERTGSATVWGPSLLWADVWATALFVDPVAGREALAVNDPQYRTFVL